jgi:hypothetical protein
MWIGATLTQGTWYELSAPLPLPGFGAPQAVVEFRIEFAFTRMVPCSGTAKGETCAELVLHATPDQGALAQVTADAGLATYIGSIDARIVTDPATLLPYSREELVTWYLAGGGGRAPFLGSEHLVSTSTYDAALKTDAAPGDAAGLQSR